MKRIVFAYAGESETAVSRADGGAEPVAVVIDVGQGHELSAVRQRALGLGAVRAHVLDAREEFARDYVLPAMQGGAMFGGTRPMNAALPRPLVIRKLIEIAAIERTNTIGVIASDAADAARIHRIAGTIDSSVEVVIPEHIDTGSPEIVSTLWGRSVSLALAAGAGTVSPDDLFTLTRAPEGCPADPATVEVAFENGVPVRVNGIDMPFVELIESLETIAGAHGVGRGTVDGARRGRRETFEAPAAAVLCAAHDALEMRILPHDLLRLKPQLAHAYASLIEEGSWFAPTRDAIDAFVASAQSRVSGSVTLSLLRGHCQVCAVSATPAALGTAAHGPGIPSTVDR